MSERTWGLRPTIVDLLFGQNVASSLTFVVAGAALTALAAQFVVPLYPVPVTAQTLAVLVVGLSLGAVRGALAMALYAALGAIGLPTFSNAGSGTDVLFGPSGGYIVGFIVSAAIAGAFAERQWDHTFARAVVAASVATVSTYIVGVLGLGLSMQRLGNESTLMELVNSGITPFLPGAVIKILIAAALLSYSWKSVSQRRAAIVAPHGE
ncbi:biotin transporter BioY [Salinibacterium sp. M195]|uniref:biotin transporter BioY n=1 Tax=Salinibacterium sp. M195 TaxID=2583374 RepID=UPI001C6281DA|nr:biotin transporter BioY [Salinibacterium sp. M195]QYH36184.1 biotin transporter BioY [Salinibacterium sp. M195]